MTEASPSQTNAVTTSDATTLAILNKSEIDQQIATAHAYPRSVKSFRDNALSLCTLNEAVAAGCMYALPRDGKVIEGPSARMAEILVSAWGNCRAAARVVDEGLEFITAQGIFHDLESNSAITFEVKRRITDRQGRRYKPDMIATTGNAACSIALRNAVLKGIPKALWDDIYQDARRVAAGDARTLATRRANIIKAFQVYGVDESRILNVLGVLSMEDVGVEQIAILRGFYTAIKDGESTPEEAFPLPVSDRVAKAGDKPKNLSEFAKAAAEPQADGGAAVQEQTEVAPPAQPNAKDQSQAPSPNPDATPTPEAIEAARDAGRRLHEEGRSLRAMPGEYRDNPVLAEAFASGFHELSHEGSDA